jgi:hypothetical protein
MRGTSNRNFILKRAGGWCKSVFGACESLLEQGVEHPIWVSKYFR